MKKSILLFICFLSISTLSCADSTSDIKAVNQKVLHIEKAKDNLDILKIKLLTEQLESVPPEVMFYFNPENLNLVMAKISVGHETFSTSFIYYFENNQVLKYLKEIRGRPDNPPKRAIIYKQNGSIIWKNIDEPIISGKNMIEIYKSNMKMLDGFSKY